MPAPAAEVQTGAPRVQPHQFPYAATEIQTQPRISRSYPGNRRIADLAPRGRVEDKPTGGGVDLR